MVARGPGAVGCAHCTQLGAEVACDVCGHLVCPRCAADWSTCTLPSGKVLRLGRTARLVDVDSAGRLGLVSRLALHARCVDLRTLAWVEGSVPHLHHAPGITPGGEILVPALEDEAVGGPVCVGVMFVSLCGGGARELRGAPGPSRLITVTPRGDVCWYATDTELIAAIDLASDRVSVYDPLPRKVIQAAFLDTGQGRLASATWGEVVVHDIVDGALVLRARYPVAGDARWVAVAGPWLAVADRAQVTVRRLRETGGVGDVLLQIEGKHPCGALSRDARYLAVGDAHANVVVHDLDAGTAQTFEEHTDDVSFVRFAGDDHMLITADDDNRVILRPRGAEGYARALKAAELRR